MLKYLISVFLILSFYTSQATECLPSGDQTFGTQLVLNAFAGGCDTIKGNLIIGGLSSNNTITDLSPLSTIVHVSGTITISNNSMLTNLSGLEALRSSNVLLLLDNNQLTDISALENLMLTDLQIFRNPLLTTCCVFRDQISTIGFKSGDNGVGCNLDTEIATDTSCDPAIAPSPAPVPTVSEWGLIILSLIMMIIGTVAVSQKETKRI